MVTKDKWLYIFDVPRLSTYNGYKTSKYDSNFKFPIIAIMKKWKMAAIL